MQVISPNNVKIYNLSAGKSLPDWISERKRRSMIKKDPELGSRIELIQDFDMPIVSNSVQMSQDGQYIFASGVYKPKIKCFDVTQYSMKFERCFDSECVKFKLLSDDYSKAVFLHNDRYVEFHAQYGKYFKIRIPKFGRDFDYSYSNCDLYFVGASEEIFRFNLEQGCFKSSLRSTASAEMNCCEFNPVHELFACGNTDGVVECWDARAPSQVGLLNCNLDVLFDGSASGATKKCSITAMKFRDGLNLAVGTSTGHILLYDIRSSRPMLVKDHRYELPIKDIKWHMDSDMVVSIDKRVCKIWDRHSGKPFTSIEPGTGLNNVCLVPNSGMMFMANEAPKILVYYIPSMGPAPKWCSFLDNLTEELESNPASTVYDDYKFVTKQELDAIGLGNLVGTNVLRAYMHGYFMDIRLYKKAKLINEPFNFDEFKQRKIKEKLDKEKENRVRIKSKLPVVNTELAKRLIEEKQADPKTLKSKHKTTTSIIEDKRFAELFTDPNYQINTESEEFKLLNPVVQKANEKKLKKPAKRVADEDSADDDDDDNDASDADDSDASKADSSSSDDEHQWKQSVKEQYKQIQKERKAKEKLERMRESAASAKAKKPRVDASVASSATKASAVAVAAAPAATREPKFFEIKDGLEYFGKSSTAAAKRRGSNPADEIVRNEKLKKLPLLSRMQYAQQQQQKANSGASNEDALVFRSDSFGNKQMTFTSGKAKRIKDSEQKAIEHHLERKVLRRSAGHITKTFKKPAMYSKRPK